MKFRQPVSIEEAHESLQYGADGTVLIGGGTAMVMALHRGMTGVQQIVHLGRIRDTRFRDIRVHEGGVLIGGGVTLAGLVEDESIRRLTPTLAAAGRIVATPRIRNVATVAGSVLEGNVAADLPTALAGLGAEAILESPDGRRRVPVHELVNARIERRPRAVLSGEILTGVLVPEPRGIACYQRRSRRRLADRPLAGVAGLLRRLPDGGETFEATIGGATARLERRDAMLAPRWREDGDVVEAHVEELVEPLRFVDDHRAGAWYREELLRGILRQSLGALAVEAGRA